MSKHDEKVNKYFERKKLQEEVSNVVETFLTEFGVDPHRIYFEEDTTPEEEVKKGFSAARFYKTALKSFDAPTEKAGELGTDERMLFQKYVARNIKGTTLKEKISSINAVASGEASKRKDLKISEIMGSLAAIKMLQQTLDDYNESTAGFLFEAFLSGLLKGKQVTEKVGGTLPIEDCMFFVDPKTGQDGQPVSLKLLSPTTKTEGSIANLLGFFQRPEIAAVAEQKGIEYIVTVKRKNDELDVFSFTIKPSNFFEWVHEKYFDLNKLSRILKAELLEEQVDYDDPETIENNAADWQNFVSARLPMMGIDPEKVEFDYSWKNANNWKNIIKAPSASRTAATDTASITISDAGKKAYETWKRSELAKNFNTSLLDISGELEQGFLQTADNNLKIKSAQEIAEIAKKRRGAYFQSIEHSGVKFRESPIHIQRWYALQEPGKQHVQGSVIGKLNDFISDGSADKIIRWSKLLQSVHLSSYPQFDINPSEIASRGTIYGTIKVSKKRIYSALRRYSEQLESLCAPIYETLEDLTSNINNFYLQNRVKSAFDAEGNAKLLASHTEKLAESQKKED